VVVVVKEPAVAASLAQSGLNRFEVHRGNDTRGSEARRCVTGASLDQAFARRPNSLGIHELASPVSACKGRFLMQSRLGLAKLQRHYSAASASAWLGKRPAYLVMPTMVNTLVKCAERPKA
jgi:hypothetical protein